MLIIERYRNGRWEPALTDVSGRPDASKSLVETNGQAIDTIVALSDSDEKARFRYRDYVRQDELPSI